MKIAPKKSKTLVWFFGSNFCLPPSHSSQDPRIHDKHFWEFTHRIIEFESPAITMGGGEVTKIAAGKIKNVGTALKKCLKCGRDKLPSLVAWHQAARPSRSTNLAGRLTVWTHLYNRNQLRCQKYASPEKKLKIKVVRNWILSRKVCECICLSPPPSWVELGTWKIDYAVQKRQNTFI